MSRWSDKINRLTVHVIFSPKLGAVEQQLLKNKPLN